MNFLWRKMAFSLSNHRSLVLFVLQGSVISKIINPTEIRLFKAIFPCRFPTVRAFYAKYRKGISMEKNGMFSVQSSFCDFVCPKGCCDLQNNESYGNNTFESHFYEQISNSQCFLCKISKMNFLWGKMEFSTPNLRSLIFPVLKGAVLSKIRNHTKIGLFKGIFPCRFPTIGAFYAKYRK